MSPLSVRSLAAVVLAIAAAAGCGGKDKKDATTPTASSGGAAGGQTGGATAGGGADGAAGAEGPTGIQPPGLDLPAAEKQRRVAEHLKRGQTALDSSRDPDFAINESKAALAVDETSVDAMVLLAQAYYVKGYYDLVQDVLEKALERNGAGNKKLHFLFGLIHDRNKRNDQALDEYQKAVAIDPNYKSALMNLGVHFLRNKRYQDAVTLYERLTGQLGYKTASSLTNLGSAYRGQSAEFGTSDIARRNELLLKAERTYKAALAADRNYANAYYNTGLLYLDADPFPEGRADMDMVKRLQRAKSQFDEYRRLPGADQKLADEQVAVAQKLIDKEGRARQKAAERDAKRKVREAKDAADKAKEDSTKPDAAKAPGTTP
ncbi:MAG TPA: tetratricopeptide repeat protein [Kofleriaceae bacterium]|nr:tetratricopeptide repeat protein [Kofleriaceae bacterium]